MLKLKGSRVLLVGLGSRGRAACRLLCANGASVVAVDRKDDDVLQQEAKRLAKLGVEVYLGLSKPLAKLLDGVELVHLRRPERETHPPRRHRRDAHTQAPS